MFDNTTLILYVSTVMVLAITPGPAVIYIVSRSIDQGRKAGIMSVFGIALGRSPQALAVAAGVTALLASSLVVFSILKYIGAAYLVYLGIRRLLRKNSDNMTGMEKPGTGASAFFQSVIVGLTNPKSILFYMAFLPQFIDPIRGSPALQTMVLWGIFESMVITLDSIYAIMASGVRRLLIRRKGFSTAGRYISGSVYIGLGLVAALTGSKNK